MKAVYSFFDTTGEPLQSARHWLNPEFFLYSWVVSTHQAAAKFSKVELVTDSKSKILFENLELPFTTIRTDLDEILDYNKEFWALGKIKAYQIQDEPFIHIDNDVIIFNELPRELLNAKILFQNKEANDWFNYCYQPQVAYLDKVNYSLPKSWKKADYAVNCGIYLCNELEFNKEYCKQAFQLVDNNYYKILHSEAPYLYSVIFEQFMAANIAEEMKIEPLFLSENNIEDEYSKYKYVHIWGEKRNKHWFESIKNIVKRDYPYHFELINNLLVQNV